MFVAKILRQDLLVTDNRKLLEKWRGEMREGGGGGWGRRLVGWRRLATTEERRARATDDRPACCKPDAPERLSGGAFEEICARLASRVAV